jgi:hypothetical protein
MQYYMLIVNGRKVLSHDGKVVIYTEKEITLSANICVVGVTIEGEYLPDGSLLCRADATLFYGVRKSSV